MKVIRKKNNGTETNGNLILHIKRGDAILIDGGISVHLKDIPTRNRIEVLINAPKETRIRRKNYEKRNNIQAQDPEDSKGNS